MCVCVVGGCSSHCCSSHLAYSHPACETQLLQNALGICEGEVGGKERTARVKKERRGGEEERVTPR